MASSHSSHLSVVEAEAFQKTFAVRNSRLGTVFELMCIDSHCLYNLSLC